MAKIFLLVIALCCLSASSPTHGLADLSGPTSSPNDFHSAPTLIDRLRIDYLRLERDLWNLIYIENDAVVSLEAVHKAHLSFFRADFGENQVPLDEIDPDHLQLFHAFATINRTVSVLVKNYLHSNPLRFDKRRTIAICRQLSNLTYHLDAINNVAVDTDLLITMKNVSDRITSYEYLAIMFVNESLTCLMFVMIEH